MTDDCRAGRRGRAIRYCRLLELGRVMSTSVVLSISVSRTLALISLGGGCTKFA